MEEEPVEKRRVVAVEDKVQVGFGQDKQRDEHRDEGQRKAREEQPVVPDKVFQFLHDEFYFACKITAFF